jgi:hypothetical protein
MEPETRGLAPMGRHRRFDASVTAADRAENNKDWTRTNIEQNGRTYHVNGKKKA